jgi:hypothetical protein
MKFIAALLCSTTLFLLAACGGGGGGGSSSAGPSQPGSDSGGSNPSAAGAPADSRGTCQSQAIIGGDLFVVDAAPVKVTLLNNGGLSGGTFSFLYDYVFGFNTNNQQDKWGQVTPFAPTAPVGTSTAVQIQPPPPDLVHNEPVPRSFPRGVPIQLWLSLDDGNQPGPANISSTASIHKDLPRDPSHSASVTFFAGVGGPPFTVGLTNVSGQASPCPS